MGRPLKDTFKKFFTPDTLNDITLEEVLVEASDSVMITNGEGVICGIGHTMLEDLNAEPEEILGHTVDELVAKGYYSRSVVRECINQRHKLDGMLQDRNGHYLFSTAKPIFTEDGRIRFVITNTRGGDILDQFLQERAESQKKYEGITGYLRTKNKRCGVVAVSPEMKRVMATCRRIAYSDGTVLLTGESGTGKEICATYIYENSQRSGETFLPINCSAIPSELVESELFGYEKGAFTGADAKGRMGMLEVANHGTVFLDEIGELPLHVQPKLLRFLETGEIKRVGGTRYITSDVRVIAATNRDLRQLVSHHKFREDLFYRLNVLPIHIPPLRDRQEDIIPLAEFFLNRFNRKYGKNIALSTRQREQLLRYDWPGNIRELRNSIERTVIIASKGEFAEFPVVSEETRSAESETEEQAILPLREVVKDFEAEYIRKAIRACGGNLSQAARLLGVHRTQLYRKLSDDTP